MTLAYEPKLVAVSALALACFSVGFSVTLAAYLGAAGPAHAAVTHADVARLAPAGADDATRGCRRVSD
ncbi:MAG TPA: hypothetical protein VMI54_07775 [Polyangiaceae bacterium]|nr:hypothetical protein [Polyangiaceae bacterium]